ncbi:MAG: hypothetical protein II922_10215 [Succinimonas sp.]|nr:hypothetical protein [Succinimonas sp.]
MIAEMEYAESFDEYMERALNKAKKEGRNEGRKEAVEEAGPRIAKEAVKKAEPEIVRNYVDKLHRYLNSFKEGKMTKEAAAKKLDMTLAQFETLFC